MLNCKSATPDQKKTALNILAALYERRSEDVIRHQSLSALLMCDDKYLQTVLAPCLQSLKAPLPKAPESPENINKSDKDTFDSFMRHVTEAIVVMRVGKPSEQQAALQRFRELYMSAKEFSKINLLRAMRMSKYPEARSFLAGVIVDPPEKFREQCMLIAANTILAISAGQLCD